MTVQVQHLSKEVIEQGAEALLREYAETTDALIELPVPVEAITRYHLALRLEFADLHQELGVALFRQRTDVLGAIYVDQEKILIDHHLNPLLNPSMLGRYRFSVGHEVGHWRLHRLAVLRQAAKQAASNNRPQPAVVCRLSEAKEPIEWQADYYSACLLMPRGLVRDVWQQRFRSLQPLVYEKTRSSLRVDRPRGGGFRKVGEALVDQGYEEFADAWANYFADQFFCVSTQAMRIRLESLGLLASVASYKIAS